LDQIRAAMVLARSTIPPAASVRAKRVKGLMMMSIGELGAGFETSFSSWEGMLIGWLRFSRSSVSSATGCGQCCFGRYRGVGTALPSRDRRDIHKRGNLTIGTAGRKWILALLSVEVLAMA
jgi:hypothetical protein